MLKDVTALFFDMGDALDVRQPIIRELSKLLDFFPPKEM